MTREHDRVVEAAEDLVEDWLSILGGIQSDCPKTNKLIEVVKALKASRGLTPEQFTEGILFEFATTSATRAEMVGRQFMLVVVEGARTRYYVSLPGSPNAGKLCSFHSADRIRKIEEPLYGAD